MAETFILRGWRVVPWDHHCVQPDDIAAATDFWQRTAANAVCHLAMGSERWAAWLAAASAQAQCPFLFTSSAMVFTCPPQGPYAIDAQRNATDPYGQYKMRCEDAIWQANPQAMVVRLGWQIGAGRGGNQMLEHLWQQHEKNGVVLASDQWLPATSRMTDTAGSLFHLMDVHQPGLYHLDSNAHDALDFHQLVLGLKQHFKTPWLVKPTQDYVHDQRLLDTRFSCPALHQWLIR